MRQVVYEKLYRYLFETFVEKTEPNLSTIDLLRLNPYVGNQIKEILPNPFDLMDEVVKNEKTNQRGSQKRSL